MSNDPFRLGEYLPYQLSITSNAVSNRIATAYREASGLKVPEWRVMAVLGDAGELTQRELTARTLMDKVAVNRACKVLEQRGLAVRQPNKNDGRSHLLDLTDEGKAMHEKLVPIVLDMEREIFAGLNEGQLESLRELLSQIRKGTMEESPEA